MCIRDRSSKRGYFVRVCGCMSEGGFFLLFTGFFAVEIEVEIWIWGVGSIFYIISIVGGVVQCINDKNGGTLPVLKNEIIDFFFARLGTGSTSLFLTSQRMPSRYGCVHTHIQLCKYIHAVSSVGYTIDVNDSFLLPSKYRRTSLHKAYHRVFDFVKSKSTG